MWGERGLGGGAVCWAAGSTGPGVLGVLGVLEVTLPDLSHPHPPRAPPLLLPITRLLDVHGGARYAARGSLPWCVRRWQELRPCDVAPARGRIPQPPGQGSQRLRHDHRPLLSLPHFSSCSSPQQPWNKKCELLECLALEGTGNTFFFQGGGDLCLCRSWQFVLPVGHVTLILTSEPSQRRVAWCKPAWHGCLTRPFGALRARGANSVCVLCELGHRNHDPAKGHSQSPHGVAGA